MNLINAIAEKIRHSFNHEWELVEGSYEYADSEEGETEWVTMRCKSCGKSKQISVG